MQFRGQAQPARLGRLYLLHSRLAYVCTYTARPGISSQPEVLLGPDIDTSNRGRSGVGLAHFLHRQGLHDLLIPKLVLPETNDYIAHAKQAFGSQRPLSITPRILHSSIPPSILRRYLHHTIRKRFSPTYLGLEAHLNSVGAILCRGTRTILIAVRAWQRLSYSSKDELARGFLKVYIPSYARTKNVATPR